VTRCAVVDDGSNSIRLLIAECERMAGGSAAAVSLPAEGSLRREQLDEG
jgi:exopolyphosphatase/pppGpp-phosphohydrolase